MLRVLQVAVPASWVLALPLTIVFARSAALPTLILGALVVSAWWASFGAALGRSSARAYRAAMPGQPARVTRPTRPTNRADSSGSAGAAERASDATG